MVHRRVKAANRHPDSLRATHLFPVALASAAAAALLPGPPGRAARRALALYGFGLAGFVAIARSDRPVADRAALTIVFATMHFGWGGGFLAGCGRMGPPIAALCRAAGLRPRHPRPQRPASY